MFTCFSSDNIYTFLLSVTLLFEVLTYCSLHNIFYFICAGVLIGYILMMLLDF